MWGYVCINSGDEYLAHSAKGSTWKDHKYIKKEGDRYYYADTKGKVTKPGDMSAGEHGPEYEMDEGDKECMENHRNGTDPRTYEEYMADKQAKIDEADAHAEAQASANKSEGELVEEFFENEEKKKKQARRDRDSKIVRAAGEAFIKRYW